MTRRRFLALGLPVDEPPKARVLLLTSGRSCTFRVWGAYSTEKALERDRKFAQGAYRGRIENSPEWNPPLEATIDELIKEKP